MIRRKEREDPPKTPGRALRWLRSRSGKHLGDLARFLDCSVSAVSAIETECIDPLGDHPPLRRVRTFSGEVRTHERWIYDEGERVAWRSSAAQEAPAFDSNDPSWGQAFTELWSHAVVAGGARGRTAEYLMAQALGATESQMRFAIRRLQAWTDEPCPRNLPF